jgi:23S rRNA (pseudouridine1915-N3)-methyltransferase
MKISIISIGFNQDGYVKQGITLFEKRINHYTSLEMIYLNEPKNMKNQPEQVQKELEGKVILSALEKADLAVLLDVQGPQMSSEIFSKFLQRTMNKGIRNLAFIIGGPYGFSEEVYRKVTEKISLSSMTFSHQLIRLIFLEQLYRGFTILKGEPYHHA